MRRLFASSQEFHTIGNESMYHPVHRVDFKSSNKLTVFDSTTKEKRRIPYEIKETTFKNVMGFLGFAALGYIPMEISTVLYLTMAS